MKEKYCFTYSERQSFIIECMPMIPAAIVSFVFLLSGILPPILILRLSTSELYPAVYFLGAWMILSFLPLFIFCIYCGIRYNTSVTYAHWYFNQIIEIDGDSLIVNQSNGQDEFHEELHINKIKKRKYAIYYYESRHRYVAIPMEVIQEQEKR